MSTAALLDSRVHADLINAMKAGDSLKVSVLRMLLSEMNYKKINVQRDLADTDITEVITREVKKRREAIESYTKGGRTEQAETEKQELEILDRYMPVLLSEAELKEQLSKISEIKEQKDFGQVMKIVAPMFKGKADGTLVAKTVRDMITNG